MAARSDDGSAGPDHAGCVMKAAGDFHRVDALRPRSGSSAAAGIVVPYLADPMIADVVSTPEHALRRDGFDLVSARNDPEQDGGRLARPRSRRTAAGIVGIVGEPVTQRLKYAVGFRGSTSRKGTSQTSAAA